MIEFRGVTTNTILLVVFVGRISGRSWKKDLLNFNLDKSEQMLMQYSKSKQVQKESLILNGQVIKEVESYKYLGDLKNTKGTVNLCINKRINCALGVINEMKFLIKKEALKKQGFAISIKLIEAMLIPKVLYACETWTNSTKKQNKGIEKLQKDAVTIINSLPQSMPYDGIVLECGLMPMEFRIKEKRLMYFHKILSMNESRLTKIVYEEQKRLNFPNCWYKEVISDLKMIDINLKECQIKNLTKQQWKKIVREKMIIITENNIKNMKKTKLRFIKDSKFGMKEYLGCEEASSLLKLKLNMVDLRANYKGKYTDSLCRRCGSHEEYIEHLWDCPNFYQRPETEKICLDTNNSEVLKSINKTLQRFLTQ